MTYIIKVTSYLLLFFLLSSSISSAQGLNSSQIVKNDIHEFLIKFKKDSVDQLTKNNLPADVEIMPMSKMLSKERLRSYGAKMSASINKIGLSNWRQARINKTTDIKQKLEELKANPNIELVEPNYIYTTQAIPSDSQFSDMWGLNNIGQDSGIDDSDIDAPEAWDNVTGDPNVIIAVIDTGIDYNHQDLVNNIWINQNEIPDNGIDDDNNGFIDDIHGYDFFNEDGDPIDDDGHGTHVAGTIAAQGDNNQGVTGVIWEAQLMPIKFLGADGGGSTIDAVNSVLYAVSMGARVINASWGSPGNSAMLRDAINAANEAGILFVAAAGNETANNDVSPSYPANFQLPNVISVAATTRFDELASFSNYGRDTVHIGAPGLEILSTTRGNSYGLLSGTSMATPHVSGAAALLLAQNNTRDAEQLKLLLLNTTDKLDSLTDKTISGGRLNIGNAINCNSNTMMLSSLGLRNDFNILIGENKLITLAVNTCDGNVLNANVNVSFSNGESSISLYDDGTRGDLIANDGIYSNSWLPQNNGVVDVTFTVTHPSFSSASQIVAGTVNFFVDYTQEATVYRWLDTNGGISHQLDDDGNTEINIEFDFEFYGVNKNTVIISSNGFLTFGNGANAYVNTSIPNPEAPNALVAPMWDDFNPVLGGTISHLVTGAAPNRVLTVSWEDVQHYGGSSPVSFQVSLYESSNEIIFQYQNVNFNDPDYNFGSSATVGIENFSGSNATEFSFDRASLTNESAIKYSVSTLPFAHPGGPYSGQAGEDITFDSSATLNPDGGPLTFSWDFGDGNTSDLSSPVHRYVDRGIYDVSLVVSNQNLTSPVTYTKAFIGQNNPPVASISNITEGQTGQPIQFDGSNSFDSDGDELTYLWDFGDGNTSNETSPIHVYTSPGNYQISLTVTDLWGSSGNNASTISIINLAPVVNAGGPYIASLGYPLRFDASNTVDADGDVLTFLWDFGDGGTGSGVNPRHVYQSVGEFIVVLTVSDGVNTSVTVNTNVTVSANEPPTANVGGPYSAGVNEQIVFDGSASSDPDNAQLTYTWSFGDGNTAQGVQPSHSYISAGVYTVRLVVSDGMLESSAQTTVNIANQTPVANPGGPYANKAGSPIQFDGTGSYDPDGIVVLTFRWNFGDGSVGNGSSPSHTYISDGEYTVSLVVSDGVSESIPVTTTASISSLPRASAGTDQVVNVGSLVNLDGAASVGVDAEIVSYQWTQVSGKAVNIVDAGAAIATFVAPLEQESWSHIAAGEAHTCAIQNNGSLWCWGKNDRNQLGVNTFLGVNSIVQTSSVPLQLLGNDAGWQYVTAGAKHSCAIDRNQVVWCWGANTYGQLGNDTNLDAPSPIMVELPNGKLWQAVEAGTKHTCALNADNEIWCWGQNFKGQLGNTSTTNESLPVMVSSTQGNNWSKLRLGGDVSCGIRTDNSLWCWGDNNFNKINSSATLFFNQPTEILSDTNSWLEVSPSIEHMCAISGADKLYCWGNNRAGQLGNNSLLSIDMPELIQSNSSWINVSTGLGYSCGIDSNNNAKCWGNNSSGKLGTGDLVHKLEPSALDVNSNIKWNLIALNNDHSCGLSKTGEVFCWGSNAENALGYGANANELNHWVSPRYVKFKSQLVFNLEIADINGATDNDTVTYSLNSSPVAFFATDSFSSLSTPIKFSALQSFDPDGDTLEYRWDLGDSRVYSGVNQFIIEEIFDAEGSYPINLTVTDEELVTDTYQQTLDLVNDKPRAIISAISVSIIGDSILFQGDSSVDPQGLDLTYHWDFGDGSQSSEINPTHAYSEAGVYTVTLFVNNGVHDSNVVSHNIVISNALAAVNDSRFVNEDTSINIPVLLNDSYTEDANISPIKSYTLPSNGELEQTNNSFVYTPALNFSGDDSFSYTIQDTLGNEATAVVTLNIIEINDAPIANTGSMIIGEGETETFNLSATDVESSALQYRVVSDVENGTLEVLNASRGLLRYTPNSGFHGTDGFSFLVNDEDIDSNVANFEIIVNQTTNSNLVVDDVFETYENTTLDSVDVFANDTLQQNGTTEIIEFTQPGNGNVEYQGDGIFYYQPNTFYVGQDEFEYTVQNGTGIQSKAVVSIDVRSLEEGAMLALVQEDMNVELQLRGINNEVQYDILNMPSKGVLTLSDELLGIYNYAPNENVTGEDRFSYQISDGVSSRTVEVNIEISPVNDSPAAGNDEIDVVTNEEFVTDNLLQNDIDVDGDSIFVSEYSQPTNGSVNYMGDGIFRYVPTQDYVGEDEFEYVIKDSDDAISRAKVVINVTSSSSSEKGDGENAKEKKSSSWFGSVDLFLLYLFCIMSFFRFRRLV